MAGRPRLALRRYAVAMEDVRRFAKPLHGQKPYQGLESPSLRHSSFGAGFVPEFAAVQGAGALSMAPHVGARFWTARVPGAFSGEAVGVAQSA